MSQRQLAQQSGVDHSTISRLIRGDRMPSLGTATKLARGLRELREDADTPQYLGLVTAGARTRPPASSTPCGRTRCSASRRSARSWSTTSPSGCAASAAPSSRPRARRTGPPDATRRSLAAVVGGPVVAGVGQATAPHVRASPASAGRSGRSGPPVAGPPPTSPRARPGSPSTSGSRGQRTPASGAPAFAFSSAGTAVAPGRRLDGVGQLRSSLTGLQARSLRCSRLRLARVAHAATNAVGPTRSQRLSPPGRPTPSGLGRPRTGRRAQPGALATPARPRRGRRRPRRSRPRTAGRTGRRRVAALSPARAAASGSDVAPAATSGKRIASADLKVGQAGQRDRPARRARQDPRGRGPRGGPAAVGDDRRRLTVDVEDHERPRRATAATVPMPPPARARRRPTPGRQRASAATPEADDDEDDRVGERVVVVVRQARG